MDLALGGLRLLLVLALCYAAGAGLFAERSTRTEAGLTAVWFTAGMILLSFFFLLSKVVGVTLVFSLALPALVAGLLLFRRPDLGVRAEHGAGEWGLPLALILLGAAPVLIMGARMGAGAYPAEFFARDTPFFMQQVYALLRTESYPPPSLETYGFSFKYHYGFQAFAALASLMTGLKPHFVMFAVVHPLLEVLAGIVVYDLCRRLTGQRGAALACLFLVLLGSRQYFYSYYLLDPSWWRFLTHEENFNFRFPNGPDAAGLLIALCALRCVLEFERRNMRLAALFFTCALPLFKIPYLIPVGLGIGLIYAYELWKRYRGHLLAEICGAGLLSALLYFVFSRNPGADGGTAIFQLGGFVAMAMPWDNETLLILSAVIVTTAAVTRHAPSGLVGKVLFFVAAPYLVFSVWRLEIENEYQIFTLAVRLVALFMAVYLAAALLREGPHRRYRRAAFAALLVVLTAPGLVSLFNHVYIVAAHPERGHEYVNNRAIADALVRIPLQGTLIATNDVRYPANDYARDYRQFQLAGIFGHRNSAPIWCTAASVKKPETATPALRACFSCRTGPRRRPPARRARSASRTC